MITSQSNSCDLSGEGEIDEGEGHMGVGRLGCLEYSIS